MRNILMFIITLVMVATLHAADAVPIGHADFYPSDERPVGYRGDGTGWFPGATIVREWQEGAPVEKETTVPDLMTGKPVKAKYIDLDVSKAKNIIWKTQLPSWANTPPLVVGDKVFTMGELWGLTCVDANSGKILWTYNCSPWNAAGVERNKAEKLEKLFEIMYAARGITSRFGFGGTMSRGLGIEEVPSLVRDSEKDMPVLLEGLKQIDPENFAAYESAAKKVLTTMEPLRHPDQLALTMIHGRGNVVDFAKLGGGKNGPWNTDINLLNSAIAKRIQTLSPINFPYGPLWGNIVGFCMQPPVSDGKRVYARTFQGQAFCLDLDGKLIWAKFDPRCAANPPNGVCANPPVLLGDSLYIGYPGGRGKRSGTCYDKLTGETKWTVQIATTTNYEVNPVVPMQLSLGAQNFWVFVLQDNTIVRAKDGVKVGQIPIIDADTSASAVARGDIFLRGGGKSANRNVTAFRLVAKDETTVEVTRLYETRAASKFTGIIATDKNLIVNEVIDIASGAVLAPAFKDRYFSQFGLSDILCGNVRIETTGEEGGMVAWNPLVQNGWGGRRFDDKTLIAFAVIDYSNLNRPKILTKQNWLGSDTLPPVPWMQKWTPALYANPTYYDKGGSKPPHIMDQDTGVYPQGNRLYIRTTGHLYCIGPAVKGTSQDDPKAAETIRALTKVADLLPYLDKTSALERCEATQVLGKLGPDAAPAIAKLTALVKGDIYEEIRAAAVIALDTIDAAGKPGTAAMQAAVIGQLGTPVCLTQTLILLGTERAEGVILPLLAKEREENVRLAAVRALDDAGLQDDKIDAALLNSLATEKSQSVFTQIGNNISTTWPKDPARAILVRDTLAKCSTDIRNGEQTFPSLFSYITDNLPPAERATYLFDVAKGKWSPRLCDNAIGILAAQRPFPDGFADWVLERAKAGDGKCIQQLATVVGKDTAGPCLVELLNNPNAICVAAIALAQIKYQELSAATALVKIAPTVDRRQVFLLLSACDAFIDSPEAAIRQALVPSLIALLGNDRIYPETKRGVIDRLVRLKQDAAPALEILKKLSTSTDKGLSDAATAAIKAIELPAEVKTK